ncbi:acyltransferase family protein [Microbacterium pygmaeum]|uniref:Peptidoglycan/LPS O-acetylase OafA/YrhL, contains acyltransferase and SGNH-hydrolase domains n=1 Tax=Microbacterium pygmaeum TaxID=370764 RepID=A0A1G8CUX4_9MICO|nr:acyltransferase [Microbacterium pygmaeum]SDH48959.1 Peptidoglycan/LPS O-acetylase OafA/YrhL, contains acyltransferase and SGNH-hydrolase domains [Microbacterium pygmaeum]
MSTPATGSRISSLDGLRGAAALVVLLHHALLTMSGFAAVYWAEPFPAYVAAFAFTPLHAVWAGPEAVLVFFVLSGVVLTLPAVRGRALPWRAYYPSRLIRLYLPVVFAVGFALLLARVWPRRTDSADSPWIQMHNEAPTLANAAKNAFLLNGTTWLNSPLWSLQWEVLFSLLLPLYLWLALRLGRRQWQIIGGIMLALILIGETTGVTALRFLPFFGLGALIAVNLDRLRSVSARFDQSGGSLLAQLAIAAGAVLLLIFQWWPGSILSPAVKPAGSVAVALGAVLLVLVAVCLPRAQRLLTSRALRAAGMISFSLYLVHEPILVTLAVIAPGDMSWIAPVVGIPLSLAAGWVFYLIVERATHRLARLVARRLADRRRRDTDPAIGR